MTRVVNPVGFGEPSGYSNGIVTANGLVFVAGQIGWDETQTIVSDVFTDQFDQALGNVLAVVSAAGGRPASITKLTIFVTDKAAYLAEREEIGRRYRERMGRHYPAMTLVEVKSLLEDRALVEIEAVAELSHTGDSKDR
jgi:enamine deaminase RidA (YjgF/YER057c/UK114 family)